MPARSTHACALAANIVRDLCGDIVAVCGEVAAPSATLGALKVYESACMCLLKKGKQSFRELLRNSGLSVSQLREALLVLVQHNWATCHRVGHEGFGQNVRIEYVYEAEIERMLQILRKPWLLMHIRDEMGELTECIVEGLVENGRLRLDHIVSSVSGKTGKSIDSIRDEVVQKLVALIRAHYIERAPPCDLPLMPIKPHPDSVKRKSAKTLKEEAERDAWIDSAHAMYQQERFRLPQELLSMSMDAILGKDAGAVKTAGEKRKRSDPDPVDQSGDGLADDSILWRVNCEEFNRAFRHQACVDIVESKLDRNAGFALKCMLEATRSSESQVNEPVSRQVSEEEISKAADQLMPADWKDAPDDLSDSLKALREDQLEFVTCVGQLAAGDMYVVNLKRIVECMQLVEVETAVRDRFSINGLRIFRLLLLRRQLEHKQIADLAMLDSKETWSFLYKMLKAGYIRLQDVPRGIDHAASRMFHTWTVSLEDARTQFVDDLFRGMHNCHCRLMHELRKGKELLELLEIAQGGSETLNITEAQRKSAARLSQTVRTLEVQLFRLDHLTAVMCDFAH